MHRSTVFLNKNFKTSDRPFSLRLIQGVWHNIDVRIIHYTRWLHMPVSYGYHTVITTYSHISN